MGSGTNEEAALRNDPFQLHAVVILHHDYTPGMLVLPVELPQRNPVISKIPYHVRNQSDPHVCFSEDIVNQYLIIGHCHTRRRFLFDNHGTQVDSDHISNSKALWARRNTAFQRKRRIRYQDRMWIDCSQCFIGYALTCRDKAVPRNILRDGRVL